MITLLIGLWRIRWHTFLRLKFGNEIVKINGEDVAKMADGCYGYLTGYTERPLQRDNH
ncbi:MAG: hypothetical protein AAGG59_06680 [Bacteroidota bacterium]